MTYAHTNSRGKQYFLNTKEVTLRNGKLTTIYYFSKDERDTGCELPERYVVAENSRTGLPVLKKA